MGVVLGMLSVAVAAGAIPRLGSAAGAGAATAAIVGDGPVAAVSGALGLGLAQPPKSKQIVSRAA